MLPIVEYGSRLFGMDGHRRCELTKAPLPEKTGSFIPQMNLNSYTTSIGNQATDKRPGIGAFIYLMKLRLG